MKSISIDDFYSLSLNEINNIDDLSLKKEVLVLYTEEIKKLEQDPIGYLFIDPNKSIEEIYFDIEQYIESFRSKYLFDNDRVRFYPSIKEVIANKDTICHFSGGIIRKGSLYLNYRPLLQNMDTNKKYVLKKTIKVEIGYRDLLPTTLKEFEEFIYNLDNAYSLNKDNELDYYSINCNLGSWSLLELKNKKKTKVLK